MGQHSQYLHDRKMVRFFQFYLSVRALVKDLDNALLWIVYNNIFS